MKILELFCGTKSFANVCKKRGHEIFTVDIEKNHNPDLVKDIMKLKLTDIPFKPDVIWASPPCTSFSVASIYRYWENGLPKNDKTIHGLMIVAKTISIIKALNPKFWIIENPRGMLRKQWLMKGLNRRTVTYCQYGKSCMKPTDLWDNLGLRWNPRLPCKPGASCHESAKRGQDKGTQNQNRNPIKRAIVPKELCLEIIKACE